MSSAKVSVVFGLFVVSCSVARAEEAGELLAWRENVALAQTAYMKAIPAEVLRSLEKSKPELRPLAFEMTQVARGDFNCDGKSDYALIAAPRSSAIFAGLQVGAKTQDIEKAKVEYHRLAYDKPTQVLIALSDTRGAWQWSTQAGSSVAVPQDLGCTSWDDAARDLKLDVNWIKQKKCSLLSIGCCEKDGTVWVWDKNKKELVGAGGC